MIPTVSLLIPTRNRLSSLIECVSSFQRYAVYPERNEILLRVDEDDDDTIRYFKYDPYVKMIIGKRPENGYGGLHHLYNELYRESTGRYVWVLNDDVIVETVGWDVIIKDRYLNTTGIVWIRHNCVGGNLFPLISRAIPQKTGWFGLIPSIDLTYEWLCRDVPQLRQNDDRLFLHHTSQPRAHDLDGLPHVENMEGGLAEAVQYRDGVQKLQSCFV
jgi:glycosyltransferase involved in cell wall biosynthesis